MEIPAGLVDARETPEECAIRELYEETGYHGVVEKVGNASEKSCLMFNDPGWPLHPPASSGLLLLQLAQV